jgi:hypothetical protein
MFDFLLLGQLRLRTQKQKQKQKRMQMQVAFLQVLPQYLSLLTTSAGLDPDPDRGLLVTPCRSRRCY